MRMVACQGHYARSTPDTLTGCEHSKCAWLPAKVTMQEVLPTPSLDLSTANAHDCLPRSLCRETPSESAGGTQPCHSVLGPVVP